MEGKEPIAFKKVQKILDSRETVETYYYKDLKDEWEYEDEITYDIKN